MNKIIAIVGMCGSGKSVASDYLEKTLNYKKVYFGGVTMKKLQEAWTRTDSTMQSSTDLVQPEKSLA